MRALHTGEEPRRTEMEAVQAGQSLEELLDEISGDKWEESNPIFTTQPSPTEIVRVYLEDKAP